uniref:SGNH/GDSL hydrolase family protein n=1 Tax=Sphingobacterium sp. (strain 21) TaxID=743722 RepID=F4CA77_SPHS2
MKKFAINLAAFGLMGGCSYVILLLVFGFTAPHMLRPNLPYDNDRIAGFSNLRFREAESVKNVDVLFLGSSHTYRGYDPRIFKRQGLNTFNLGSSAQTLRQTKYLLDLYLDQMNPKVVVLDIYPKFLNLDGVESSIDLLSNTSLGIPALDMVLDIQDMRVFNTFLYNIVTDPFEQETQKQAVLTYKEDIYIRGGYTETYKVFSNSMKPTEIERDEYAFDPEQYKAMLEIKGELDKRNIKTICMQSPILPARYAKAAHKTYIDSTLRSHFPLYFNYNEINQLPEECFSDDQHLNQKGVNIFNAFVSSVIQKQAPYLYAERKRTIR